MKAFITGHEGFIGKNLIKKFDDHFGITEGYTKEDIIQKLEEYKPDAVFHVGACSDTLMKDVNYIMEVNYLATKWITDWCVENNVKIIYSSSAATYGSDGKQPSNLYGWSKLIGEDYVINKGGIALRYFNVYGPGEEHKGNMASLIYQKKDEEVVKLFPGFPKRDFVYVDDIIDANLYACDHYHGLSGKWYEVGSGESNEFEKIFDYMGTPYEYLNVNDIPKGYQFDTKSHSDRWMPGWKPKYNLESGLKNYLEYLKK